MNHKKITKSKKYEFALLFVGIVLFSLTSSRLFIDSISAAEFIVRILFVGTVYALYIIIVKMLCDIYRKICEAKED